jgi:type IV secretion system protein VirB10
MMTTQQANEMVVDTLPGESRGIPSVNDTESRRSQKFVLMAAVLLPLSAALGLGYLKIHNREAKAAQSTAKNEVALKSAAPARTFTVPPPLPGTESAQAVVGGVPGTPAMPPPLPGSAGGNGEAALPIDKAGSSLMAISEKQEPAVGSVEMPQGTRAVQGPGNGEQVLQSGGMSDALTGTATPMRKATMIGNQNFILAKGSFIDCALQTRLDSTIPGMTACVITRNIYSDNGRVLLIERGSTASGEYKSNMRQGQARIGVLWTRIKTPSGVIINLDSGGTDQLGGAGVPGYVDNHFWERFGGAILVSMIDDVARAVTSQASDSGGNQINFNGTTDAAANMGVEVLKNTINIPPTLYKNQGEQVGIYVARDLDFSSVYDVEAQ